MERMQGYKAPAAFTHSPYTTHCHSSTDVTKTNPNTSSRTHRGHTATSPIQVPTKDPDEADGRQLLSTSPITVQPRYRLHSPTHSQRATETVFSNSPVDASLCSPPFAWSGSSSFHGDAARFATAPNLSAPPEPSLSGSGRGLPPYGTNAVGSYAPAGFAMPPAISQSVLSSSNVSVGRSPIPENGLRIGSPPNAMGGMCGPGYKSPPLMPLGTPPYHSVEGPSLQSPLVSFSPTLRSHSANHNSVNGNQNGLSRSGIKGNVGSAGEGGGRGPIRQPKYRTGGGDDASNVSGSSASSIRDDLSLCPNDGLCALINDRKHQRKYAHTCRLFPCYHGHIPRHSKLFRHSPGQITQTEGLEGASGGRTKISAHALTSVNFSSISPEAPNAYKIIVSHGDQSYEIFGDWQNVRVHTFKRYLHQVYKIPPTSQLLKLTERDIPLDDDIESVGHYGVKPDSVVSLKRKEDDAPPRVPLEDL